MRFLAALIVGALFGALLALGEGFVVIRISDLGFVTPTAELYAMELRYGLILGGVALLAALVFRRRPLPVVAAATFAFGFALLLGWWVHKEVLDESRIWEPLSMAASAGVLTLAALLAFATAWLGRRHARAALLALAAVVLIAPWFARAGAGATPAAAAHAAADRSRPDVTLIIIDTLRADRLSCYGNPRLTSPNLDALAARGTRFEQCISQAPWTRPSMASLHSGMFPSSHGCNDLRDVLPKDAWTIAEALQAGGYVTAGFSANANVSPTFGFDQGFDTFWNTSLQELARFTMYGMVRHYFLKRVLHVDPDEAVDDAETLTDHAIRWLGAGHDAPVFTYVHYLDPHWPYAPAEYLIDGAKPKVFTYDPLLLPDSRYPFAAMPENPAEAIDSGLHYYDAEIRFCDRAIGRLLDHLERIGQLDPGDLLIVSADHGEQFYEHASFGHGSSMFLEELQVPLILVGGGVPAGLLVKQPVRLFDVYPTILDLAGLPIPPEIPALTMKPLLDGEEPESGRPAFSERLSQSAQGGLNWQSMSSLQIGRRKLIEMQDPERAGASFYMTFDLDQNPGERLRVKPPAAGELLDRSDPAFTADPELLRYLKALQQRAREQALATSAADLPPDVQERLKKLGYAK